MGVYLTKYQLHGLTEFEAVLGKAAMSTIRKVSRSGRALAARAVAKRYNITVTEAKKRIVFEITGTGSRLVAMNRGRKIPRSMFKPKQEAKGVSIQVAKNGERIVIPHSFLATGKIMGKQVFIRIGAKRLPITVVKGMYMAELITDDIRKEVIDQIKPRIQKVFAQELKFYQRANGLGPS